MKMKKIIAVFLLLTISFSLTACGGQKPTEAVTEFLVAAQNCDYDAIKDAFVSNTDDYIAGETDKDVEEIPKFINMLLPRLIFSDVKQISKDGNTAVVEACLTTPDAQELIGLFISQVMDYAFRTMFDDISDEERDAAYEEIAKNVFESDEINTITKTVQFQMEKVDKKWKIVNTEEAVDAILGGYITFAKKYSK